MLTTAGTPPAVIDKLNREIVRIMLSPEVKELLSVHGYDVSTGSPQDFARLIRSDLAKWEKVVKASGARVD